MNAGGNLKYLKTVGERDAARKEVREQAAKIVQLENRLAEVIEKVAAKDEIIAAKNKTIDELRGDLTRAQHKKPLRIDPVQSRKDGAM